MGGKLVRRSGAVRSLSVLAFACALIVLGATAAFAKLPICRSMKRCDTAPPSVSISSPPPGATVRNMVSVTGLASDNVGLRTVEVRVDGGSFAAAAGTSSWSFSLNTASYANGTHTVTARATDTGGRTASVSISLQFDNAAPPPPPPPTGCSGVSVSPTSAAATQSLLSSYPAGTTFCFRAGTYHWTAEVIVPSGSVLIAEPGTVVTGDDLYPAALRGYGGEAGQHDVTIRGFIVEHSRATSGITAGWRWLVEDNEVRYNLEIGIQGNAGTSIRRNNVHHNGRYGVTSGGTGMMVEDNEIAFNNTRRLDPNNDAGGTKFVRTNGMTFRDNHVHDNYGNGVWFDWDNINITIEGNRVENNDGIGIFYEVSYGGIIRNNILTGNGVASGGSLWSLGEIYLNDSQDVEIYGNVIDVGSQNAISLIDIDRGDISSYSANKRTANVSVHDNQITIRVSGGMVGLVGRAAAFSDGNRFDRNTYRLYSLTCGCFHWNGSLSYAAWRLTGNDLLATVLQL